MRGEMSYMKGSTASPPRRGGMEPAPGRLPGPRTPRDRGAAQLRDSGPVRLRLPAPALDGGARRDGRGQSHAWLEWWDGEWRSWDPTNHKPAGDFHVTVARGRDYRDVPPLKGILSGGGGSALAVTVEITRLA